jgi:hypothetical protein
LGATDCLPVGGKSRPEDPGTGKRVAKADEDNKQEAGQGKKWRNFPVSEWGQTVGEPGYKMYKELQKGQQGGHHLRQGWWPRPWQIKPRRNPSGRYEPRPKKDGP